MDYESCPSDPAELLHEETLQFLDDWFQRLRDMQKELDGLQKELDSLQKLEDALRTARPSASACVLRRVTPILQCVQAGSGITPDAVERERKRFHDALREASPSVREAFYTGPSLIVSF